MSLSCCDGRGNSPRWKYLPEIVAIIITATAAPLAAGMVPPNWLYGFRTPRTMGSPEEWYLANRILGWHMIVSQVIVLASVGRVERVLRARFGRDRITWGVLWACFASLAGIGTCAIHYGLLR